MVKKSNAYSCLLRLGLKYSKGEYSNISFKDIFVKVLITYRNEFLLKYIMNCYILAPILPRFIRPLVLKKIGCKVGKNVFIGSGVYIDSGYSKLITIDDDAHITARCVLLCHQRDLSSYSVGKSASDMKYLTGSISIGRGSMIGMNTIILPGVSIGEGAVVGAFSLVNKDIPPWSIAVGIPAKVIKKISTDKKQK